jgi:hypothetical protein
VLSASSTPTAASTTCSPKCTPSISNSARESQLSSRLINSASLRLVPYTKRSLTALLLIPFTAIAGGNGSSDRRNGGWRPPTPSAPTPAQSVDRARSTLASPANPVRDRQRCAPAAGLSPPAVNRVPANSPRVHRVAPGARTGAGNALGFQHFNRVLKWLWKNKLALNVSACFTIGTV